MFVTFLVLAAITVGGIPLTYLYDKEGSTVVRVAGGHVAGSAVFGTVLFGIACLLGFTTPAVGLALVATLLPLALFADAGRRAALSRDLATARGWLDGAGFGRIASAAYYVAILVLLWLFFDRAMIETASNGIATGGSQNLGDLPFHLGAIFSFTDGAVFPPENPSFAGAKFTYPFLADLITAACMRLGAGVRDAMLVQNVGLGLALVVLLERFTFALTGSRLAGKLAPVLLFFSGGLGFVPFLRGWWHGTRGLGELLGKLPQDYTINETYRWGNALVTLFMTQRSLLLGMPLTLIALTGIWELFTSESRETRGLEEAESGEPGDLENSADDVAPDAASPRLPLSASPLSLFFLGLLAGTLPLIHVHSLATLFVVCAALFFFRLDRWKEWTAFGVGVAVLAVPELLWSLTGSATNLSKFIEPFFGWDKGEQNFVIFWIKNTGLFVPIFLLGFLILQKIGEESDDERPAQLLIFYIPFLFLFVISNTMKLAPWQWDNIKVLIYWFVGSLPFAAYGLAWMWKKGAVMKAAFAVSLAILTFSGALDVWRTVDGQIDYGVFGRDSVKTAAAIKEKTPQGALFLNAPTYNSSVVLSGRRSLMRYSGHLSSYGIDYEPREKDVKRIYAGGPLAQSLLDKYGIEYVIISPEETGNVDVDEAYFGKFPLVIENGAYKVYKIK